MEFVDGIFEIKKLTVSCRFEMFLMIKYSLALVFLILSFALGQDFCAVSKIKRKLSNEIFSKTSDYDATQRLVETSAESLLKMKPRTEKPFMIVNCGEGDIPLDPMVNIAIGYAGFPVGFCNDSLAKIMLNTDYSLELLKGNPVNESYFNEPDDENYVKDDIELWLGNAKDLLPVMLNSIKGGLSTWILLGINQLSAAKTYNPKYVKDFEEKMGCGFNQTLMWSFFFVPAIPFLPRQDGTKPGPSWTRPTADSMAGQLMTEFIYPLYVNKSGELRYKGQLIADIAIEEVFGDITKSKPTANGFYFLMSMENGAIVSATNDVMVELFHNVTANVAYFYNKNVFLPSTDSEWNKLFDIIRNEKEDHYEVPKWEDEKVIYYITWDAVEKYKYALVAAIPTNELFGASWIVEPSVITFRYTTGEEKSQAELKVKNTGLYDAKFTITTNDRVTLNQQVGQQYDLPKGKSLSFTFTYDLTKGYDDNLLITFSPAGDNIECYTAILTPVKTENIDCVPDDYSVELGECVDYYRDVIYSKKNTSYCRDGMALPPTDSIPCEWMDGAAFIAVTVIISAFVIFTMVYTAAKQIKNFSELRALLAPLFFYTYSVGLVLLVISALTLAIGKLNKADCAVYEVFRGMGYSFVATAMLVTLMQINTKFVNNDIIFIRDIFYLLEFLVPVIVLEAVILYLTSPFYDDWSKELNGKTIIMTTCMNSEDLKSGFMDILILVIAVVNIGYAIKILTSKAELGKSTLQVTRVCFGGSVIILINPLTSFITKNGFPNYAIISYIYLAVILLLTFVMIGLTPFKQWFFCKNPEVTPDTKTMFSQVLKNPITRLYLQKHMKDLLQEENIIFWEAVNELRNAPELSENIMHECIMHIYKRFISESGDLEININDSMKKQITKEVNSNILTLDIYDKAMTEIEDLINVNAFYTFQSSAHFEGAKTLMNWYNNYAKMEPQAQSAVFMKVMDDGIYISGREYFVNGFENPPKWDNAGFGGVFMNKVSLPNGPNRTSGNSRSTLQAMLSGTNSSANGIAGGSHRETNEVSYTTPVTPIEED